MQGSCKVSFARPDLGLWRPAARPSFLEPPLCPSPAWWALDWRPGQRDLAVGFLTRRPGVGTESPLSTSASVQVNRLTNDFARALHPRPCPQRQDNPSPQLT